MQAHLQRWTDKLAEYDRSHQEFRTLSRRLFVRGTVDPQAVRAHQQASTRLVRLHEELGEIVADILESR
jgi:hypothetical protein